MLNVKMKPAARVDHNGADEFKTEKPESGAAAADEVDDLEAVAFGKKRGGPAVAGDNVAVEFDGNAVRLHAELFDQGGQGEPVVGKKFLEMRNAAGFEKHRGAVRIKLN
jgi:hypothetical protein